jgi:chromosome segregation ATPase
VKVAAELRELKTTITDLQAAETERERLQAELVGGLRLDLATLDSERAALEARLVATESHNAALSCSASELQAKVTRLETPIRKRIGRRIRDAVSGV